MKNNSIRIEGLGQESKNFVQIFFIRWMRRRGRSQWIKFWDFQQIKNKICIK
jgi:hypothetical protein